MTVRQLNFTSGTLGLGSGTASWLETGSAVWLGTLALMRHSYAESCAELQRTGLLDPGAIPPVPDHQPRFDDPEPLGVNFFRTQVDGDLSHMTLPRSFFGHSEVCDASFCNSDLSESTLCWCDFIGVDFSDACLRASDLRASSFERVHFVRCDLRDADLRRSSFKGCHFTECDLRGAKLTRNQASQLAISPQQRADVAWQTDDGDPPGGG